MSRALSFLWRGAIGGGVGALLILSYVIYKDPYTVVAGPALLILILLGGADGCFVGAAIWTVGRLFHSNLAAPVRIVLGTFVTTTLVAIYLYRHEGMGESVLRFTVYSSLVGLLVGGLAGLMARNKILKQMNPRRYWRYESKPRRYW
jgi:hypothetical protein